MKIKRELDHFLFKQASIVGITPEKFSLVISFLTASQKSSDEASLEPNAFVRKVLTLSGSLIASLAKGYRCSAEGSSMVIYSPYWSTPSRYLIQPAIARDK